VFRRSPLGLGAKGSFQTLLNHWQARQLFRDGIHSRPPSLSFHLHRPSKRSLSNRPEKTRSRKEFFQSLEDVVLAERPLVSELSTRTFRIFHHWSISPV